MLRDAVFSCDRTRRYLLTRSWGSPLGAESRGSLAWCMLNPSKAGEDSDDPTVRKCIGFAKRWGFSDMTIVNLIPIVCTDPCSLPHWSGAFTDNEPYIKRAISQCDVFAVAWGAVNAHVARTVAWDEHLYSFAQLVEQADLYCIRHTKNGSPLHPSRASYTEAPEEWSFPLC